MPRGSFIAAITAALAALTAIGQQVVVRQAEPLRFPGTSDSNSPLHWSGGKLKVFQSMGMAIRSEADALDGSWDTTAVVFEDKHTPWWIEATWHDEQHGALFAWYHYEDQTVCGGTLAMPAIGAMLSWDDGVTFQDLGLILTSGDATNCEAQNGYFAGGHGDFSVVLDPERQYFYFFFGNYGGTSKRQGVAVARMPFDARWAPVGQVRKYSRGVWTEAGLDGRVTPIFPVVKPWEAADTDAFWGPAVHWNRDLNRWVMLLNRSCCEPGWPQEGIYVSFNDNLTLPHAWTEPVKILGGVGWYPQAVGIEPGDTDKESGARVRLFLSGVSEFELDFVMPAASAVPTR